MNSYQNPATGQKYLEYLNSPDGLFQQKLLGDAILKHLPEDRSLRILDAACGSGWFTFELSKKFEHTQGFDSSEFLLHQAKQQHPELNIIKANLLEELPYPDNYFDVIILNMAITDVEDIAKLFSNLSRILKPNGKLITTIPNPSYAFPVGVWKRGLLRWVFRLKPVLKIRPWKKFNSGRKLSWKNTFSHFFYPLSLQIKKAQQQGFALEALEELQSSTDSDDFNLEYQSFRYPLFILLVLVKRGE